jgi:hypothetical protein
MAYGDTMTESTAHAKPVPRITPLNQPFWEYARQGTYAVQCCNACGHVHMPESPVCPRCLGQSQEWKPASGRGTLESWADFHRAYWDGFRDELPYRTCVVRLDEGPLVISNLVGDQTGIRLGARVHVVFESLADGLSIPKFALDRP